MKLPGRGPECAHRVRAMRPVLSRWRGGVYFRARMVGTVRAPTAGAQVSMPMLPEGKVRNYIGGQWCASRANEYVPITNPATGEALGSVPLGTAEDVDEAVAAAKRAFPAWRDTPAPVRARYLFDLRNVMEKHVDELSALCTAEHGKTLEESRGDVRRGIDNVETAAGIPSLMMGGALEQIASGIDCTQVRHPLGVFAAIAPYNFPSMVPFWFLPYAIATGNTFVVKPSEQVPLSQQRLFELIGTIGLPAGVVNTVNGSRQVVDAILEHRTSPASRSSARAPSRDTSTSDAAPRASASRRSAGRRTSPS